MFIATQLDETFDNSNFPSDSAVLVLGCCTKYQQMNTALYRYCAAAPNISR
jgi:hypothetical protein